MQYYTVRKIMANYVEGGGGHRYKKISSKISFLDSIP